MEKEKENGNQKAIVLIQKAIHCGSFFFFFSFPVCNFCSVAALLEDRRRSL